MEQIILTIPSLIKGLYTTLWVFIVTGIISIPLGTLVALGRVSKNKFLSAITRIYILIMRGTPLLLQLMLIFFGLPYINIVFSRYEAALIAFILNYGAYFAEIFRGGLEAIDKGQYEASKTLGFSKNYTFFNIVLPQVVKITLPSVGNEVVTLVKDTSLLYVLGIGELLRAGQIAANTNATLVPFIMVGTIYLCIIAIISKGLTLFENSFNYYQ